MKQAEILDNPIPQDIESWFKENKGNEFWFDKITKSYGTLELLDLRINSVYFKPIQNGFYLPHDGLVEFTFNGIIFWDNNKKDPTPQSESIKLPYYIHTDHPNNIIQLLQNGQKPKVTIQIDSANDMQLAKHIMDFLNAEL